MTRREMFHAVSQEAHAMIGNDHPLYHIACQLIWPPRSQTATKLMLQCAKQILDFIND